MVIEISFQRDEKIPVITTVNLNHKLSLFCLLKFICVILFMQIKNWLFYHHSRNFLTQYDVKIQKILLLLLFHTIKFYIFEYIFLLSDENVPNAKPLRLSKWNSLFSQQFVLPKLTRRKREDASDKSRNLIEWDFAKEATRRMYH